MLRLECGWCYVGAGAGGQPLRWVVLAGSGFGCLWALWRVPFMAVSLELCGFDGRLMSVELPRCLRAGLRGLSLIKRT